VKDLTSADLLVFSDLSKSELLSEEDQLADKAELVTNQPTVEDAKGNFINPEAWTPIATGLPRPIPPKLRAQLEKLAPKIKTTRCVSLRDAKG
jgi:hypothetical protein